MDLKNLIGKKCLIVMLNDIVVKGVLHQVSEHELQVVSAVWKKVDIYGKGSRYSVDEILVMRSHVLMINSVDDLPGE